MVWFWYKREKINGLEQNFQKGTHTCSATIIQQENWKKKQGKILVSLTNAVELIGLSQLQE